MRTLCRSKPLVPAGDASPSCPPPSLSPAPPTAVSGEPLRAVGSKKAGLGRIACRQALAARARMRGTVEARYLAALQGAPLATTSAATKKARSNNLLPLCERPRPGSGALIASPRGLKIGLYLARCWPPQQRTQQQSSQESTLLFPSCKAYRQGRHPGMQKLDSIARPAGCLREGTRSGEKPARHVANESCWILLLLNHRPLQQRLCDSIFCIH